MYISFLCIEYMCLFTYMCRCCTHMDMYMYVVVCCDVLLHVICVLTLLSAFASAKKKN